MLFNSVIFLKFFAAFLLGYWLVRHHLRARNLFILVASYVFYGWWDYRFLSLIWISTLLDYFIGLSLQNQRDPTRRRWLLGLSLTGNLGLLGFFKYFGFFADSLAALFTQIGWKADLPTLHIVLPVGISFYTFQTMSYTLDVYRRDIQATRDPLAFAAYVAFFPQLVAGPIERARHLLPQFSHPRSISLSQVEEGIWLMLWGMFKKVVVADNLALLVEMVYHPEASLSSPAVALATLAFGFQIYGDFSGYSDIARGLARLLGFDIMVNFDRPYLASNLREFWHRWHISLSTWLRDYLYISLGGNRHGTVRTMRNLFVTFLLGGLWHGAAWHFVLWGAFHGLGLALYALIRRRSRPNSAPAGKILGWFLTMTFVFYGWLLFRAESWTQVVQLTTALGRFAWPEWSASYLLNLVAFIGPLILVEAGQTLSRDPLFLLKQAPWVKGAVQAGLFLGILFFWEKANTQFIYFQF